MQIGRSFKNFWRRFYSLPYYLHEAWEPLTWPGFIGQTLANALCLGLLAMLLYLLCLNDEFGSMQSASQTYISCIVPAFLGYILSLISTLLAVAPSAGFASFLTWIFGKQRLSYFSIFAFIYRVSQPMCLFYFIFYCFLDKTTTLISSFGLPHIDILFSFIDLERWLMWIVPMLLFQMILGLIGLCAFSMKKMNSQPNKN